MGQNLCVHKINHGHRSMSPLQEGAFDSNLLGCRDVIASRPPRCARGKLQRRSNLLCWPGDCFALLAMTDFEGVCNRATVITYPGKSYLHLSLRAKRSPVPRLPGAERGGVAGGPLSAVCCLGIASPPTAARNDKAESIFSQGEKHGSSGWKNSIDFRRGK